MGRLTDKQIQHLFWRGGFGITSSELKSVRSLSKKKIVELLFTKSSPIIPLRVDLSMFEKDYKTLTKEERAQLRKQGNQKLMEINRLWFAQMQSTEGVLREKMTLFFQNHFSVRIREPRMVLHLHNTIRKHALGNFGDMLMEVSKSPAMLRFLNARQNRKGRPNENFAREVMELFTLGRDNGYTEKDIKEAARAFTGWDFNKKGDFIFREQRHDVGSKTVLGKTGNFSGEDVIQILLKEKRTASYLSKKLYVYLVNDQIDNDRVAEMADILYNNNYDIEVLVKHIFLSSWFYDPKHIGAKIKAPVELITGLNRQFNITYERPKVLFFMQNKLNQVLFYPPNVAGWPGGKSWIDNSTLMIRLKLASVILNNGAIDLEVKDNMDDEMGNEMMMQAMAKRKRTGLSKRIRAYGDWNMFLNTLETKEKDRLTDFLIQPSLAPPARQIIKASKEVDTKNFIVELLSLPEYQLC